MMKVVKRWRNQQEYRRRYKTCQMHCLCCQVTLPWMSHDCHAPPVPTCSPSVVQGCDRWVWLCCAQVGYYTFFSFPLHHLPPPSPSSSSHPHTCPPSPLHPPHLSPHPHTSPPSPLHPPHLSPHPTASLCEWSTWVVSLMKATVFSHSPGCCCHCLYQYSVCAGLNCPLIECVCFRRIDHFWQMRKI